MNLRGQILLGSLLLAVIPLALAIGVIRSGVQDQMNELDLRRVEDRMQRVGEDLDRRSERLAQVLDALALGIDHDNRFRLALGQGREDLRPYLLDYAGRHMSLMDLDMLQIQAADGRILSSGHFREAFGGSAENLPRVLDAAPEGRALMTVRTPAGGALMLVRARRQTVGAEELYLVGGVRLEEAELTSLSTDPDLSVALVWPGGWLTASPTLDERLRGLDDPARRAAELEYRLRAEGQVVRTRILRMIDQGKPGETTILAVHDRGTLHRLLRGLDLRIGAILLLTIGAAVVLAVWLAGRISRPLRRLADGTERLDLERLDVDFASDRRDEVGRLTRLLGEMIQRLRRDVLRLRDAEHRATLGEVARQVNHDVRNGLTPLRNVLGHLAEVAENDPERLGEVFAARKGTLDGGLSYLEELAAHYLRLSPGRNPQPCRLDGIAAEALAAAPRQPGTRLVHDIPTNLPPIEADPVSLRRILDNLIRNAVESLPDGEGTVQVGALLAEDEVLEEMRIVVEVADTGCGIPAGNRERIFDDFFTTRVGGTGLGLSNVRRLAADCGATLRVTSEPDHGTTFTLSFPLPPAADKRT